MKIVEELQDKSYLINNNVRIDEVVYKKISKVLEVSLVLDNALNYQDYLDLTKYLLNKFSELNLKVIVKIGYLNEELSKDDLIDYLKNILSDLSKTSARFKALDLNDVEINGNIVIFYIAFDALGFNELSNKIEEKFANYGLDINVKILEDKEKSIKEQLKEIDDEIAKEVEKQNQEAKAAQTFNKKMQESQKKHYHETPTTLSHIKQIPVDYEGIKVYEHNYGLATFLIEAYVFDVEVRTFTTSKSALAVLKVTDDTDSIVVKKWLFKEEERELFTSMQKGTLLQILGSAEYDTFAKDVVLKANKITMLGMKKEEEVIDDAPVKRVELHAHTKMSTLDGLSEGSDYIKLVSKWGWKAMAFTDHNGMHDVPEIAHTLPKFPDFKPIFGTELSFVDDSKYFITFNKENLDIDLKKASYVVFDIETTGLSQNYDEIIEIAAIKVKEGNIISSYETFVNPKCPIPELITKLTSITDDMVKDSKFIEDILPEFYEYAKDSILVAHNAKFDVGMIYRDIKKLNLNYDELPVIDTLNLFRCCYYDKVKTFNLKSLSKYFKVKQEHHHRAIDDTRVTALCFIQMLNDLYQKGVTNYKDINSLIDPNVFYRYVIPPHINLIAKNPVGYKNLFKIVSDSMTNHFYSGDARALKSVIDKYRDGILIGSGCVNGNVFELALNRSIEELEEEMHYYDYIEVQPPTCYAQLFDNMVNGEEKIKEVIIKIINTAKKLGKTVVATSDCHYTRPYLKKYRDILIASPQIGGGTHPLAKYNVSPDLHLRTTKEMLLEFGFLDKDLAYEIVVTNTNLIADMVEKFPPFKTGKDDMYAPRDDEFKNNFLHVESIEEETRRIVNATKVKLYGENAHPIVTNRLDHELNCIISNGYASIYYICHLLVEKSLSDGYLVGSRGSVGSSLVATMMNISEINPLAPHYRCKKCKFHTFKMRDDEIEKYGLNDNERELQPILRSVDSGYDLPDRKCPVCGEMLVKDGHDIPFETFLGFNGDKTPDIDLNFSGEYQATAHEYVRTVFGPENAFRAGTVGTVAEKNAYGYVKAYCEKKGITIRNCEIDRLASYLVGVKRQTGQHPGGIVVVPHYVDIYDVTPVQYPADNITNNWRTTHFDYHSFEANLLKFDILGHDDPTLIKYFMDYVHEHQNEFPFSTPQDIPIDDKNLYRLFYDTSVIGISDDALGSKVASAAVPELGTPFVQKMLVETLPKTFAQLVKISGLSHGTNVWNTNAQELVNGRTEFGKIEFKDIIGCRDDIMVDLMRMGLDPLKSFKIMEFVRKNKKVSDPQGWLDFQKYMRDMKVPEWYIWSCDKIEYMFPKAHATAYCMMSLRIAWFKVYSPKLFYSAWFSKRANAYHIPSFLGGPVAIRAMINDLSNKKDATDKDKDLIISLQVALEMTLRGIKFLPIDIFKSNATTFDIEDDGLRLPFTALDGLGESVAITIVNSRNERPFTSKKDVTSRTKLNQTQFEQFNIMHSFANLPDEDPIEAVGLFAL